MGLSDAEEEGSYTWVDGTPLITVLARWRQGKLAPYYCPHTVQQKKNDQGQHRPKRDEIKILNTWIECHTIISNILLGVSKRRSPANPPVTKSDDTWHQILLI